MVAPVFSLGLFKINLVGEKYARIFIFSMQNVTPKQKEVLKLMAKGLTAKQAADHLCIGSRTVEKHLQQLRLRFNCNNIVQLLAAARKNNIIK